MGAGAVAATAADLEELLNKEGRLITLHALVAVRQDPHHLRQPFVVGLPEEPIRLVHHLMVRGGAEQKVEGVQQRDICRSVPPEHSSRGGLGGGGTRISRSSSAKPVVFFRCDIRRPGVATATSTLLLPAACTSIAASTFSMSRPATRPQQSPAASPSPRRTSKTCIARSRVGTTTSPRSLRVECLWNQHQRPHRSQNRRRQALLRPPAPPQARAQHGLGTTC